MFFFLTVVKNFVEKPFCVPEKFLDKKGGWRVYQDLLSRKYCLTVPKTFVREHFCAVFRKFSSSEKAISQKAGECQDFSEKRICLSVLRNFVLQILYCFTSSDIDKGYD